MEVRNQFEKRNGIVKALIDRSGRT